MRQKWTALVFLLLAAIVAAYAQAPARPASAAGHVAAWASRATAGAAPAPAPAAPQSEPAPAATTHHGHHIFGMPLKWVIVGVAAVLTAITVAAIKNNRDYTSVTHPSAPMP